jgi:transposase
MRRKSLSAAQLLPKSTFLTLDDVRWSESGCVVEAHGAARAPCPACQKVSQARHGRYWRTLKDLPAQGAKVTSKVRVSRWRCRNEACAVRFFTGSLEGVVGRNARETNRARDLTVLIGHAVAGLPGERLMSRLNIPTSDDTIPRRLKSLSHECLAAEPRVIGVDEWAWAKGQDFGTILVDLEQRRVADLLPASSAETLAAWLKAHPGVKTISRDRHGRYAEGSQNGAPEAVQVADRFHLVRSLRDAIEKELAVHRQELRISLPSQVPPPAKSEGEEEANPIRVCASVEAHRRATVQQRRQEKLELFQRIHQMKAVGMKVSEISRRLEIHRKRVDKWIRFKELRQPSQMQPRVGSVGFFPEYLRQRWEQGCHHGHEPLAEIR